MDGSLLVLHSLPGPLVVKITPASGYYLAWPGQGISVSVSLISGVGTSLWD